jgi:putative oxidoreductase
MRAWGLLVLRLAVGTVFIAHGLPKLIPIWGSSPAATAAYFESIGLRPAYPLTAASGVIETAGGLMLIFGFFTIGAALALLIDIAVAIWKVHLEHGFFINWTMARGVGHGMELHLLLAGALICLLLTGSGSLSIEGRRERDAEEQAFARARLRSNKV